MQARNPAVYILASARNGTLYIGVTSDLVKRAWQHRESLTGGFTQRYGVHRLVWYELHDDMEHAIVREKRLKKWNRAWKVRLLEETNPEWRDLWEEILGAVPVIAVPPVIPAPSVIPAKAGTQGSQK